MAKNRNNDRTKEQNRSSAQAPQDSGTAAQERASERMDSPITPATVAHKGRQKRFGHN
jgi:hypothetical protein